MPNKSLMPFAATATVAGRNDSESKKFCYGKNLEKNLCGNDNASNSVFNEFYYYHFLRSLTQRDLCACTVYSTARNYVHTKLEEKNENEQKPQIFHRKLNKMPPLFMVLPLCMWIRSNDDALLLKPLTLRSKTNELLVCGGDGGFFFFAIPRFIIIMCVCVCTKFERSSYLTLIDKTIKSY